MPALDAFFADLDLAWTEPVEHPIALHLIGATALMLQTRYQRGTKDSDVLETAALTPAIQKRLAVIAGPGSPLRAPHRLYLEIVRGGPDQRPGPQPVGREGARRRQQRRWPT